MWWPVVVVALVLAGKGLSRLPGAWGLTLAWGGMLAGVAATAWDLGNADPLLRMVALCCLLLGGLKSVVYCEWCRGGRRSLAWGRYLGFGLAWFGMDPGAFARTRAGCEWISHMKIGLACMVVGTGLSVLVRNTGAEILLLVFVPMSIGFHFGALRVLTACWRWAGVPVRVLFRSPLRTSGLADFWSRRWNLGYSEMMVRVVKKPLERFVPRRVAEGAVFLVSGLLHELAITVPVGAGYGGPTLYFLLHGLAVRLERDTWPLWIRRAWVALWVAGPLGLLFPEEFFREVILRCLHMLPGN